VDRRGLEHAGKPIVPEPLDLHVLAADQPEIHQHVQADQQLNDTPRMLVFPDKKENAK